ncbi:MAG: right-handed parallel beta-helix repeat-containing protein, partial [Nanoarchaeota archaeon]|nr:right-handed parallel beta-helix repeat-containing protein [Nanoarchaeota archaeon]
GSGIYAADFTDSVIANNTISGNLTGIYISSASDNTIINNSISGHTSAATYSGINLYASEANNVTNNSIIDATSTSYGISLYAASNINNITANIISSAANIYLQLSDENIINDNTIYNGVRGFLTYMANYNNFTNNIVTGSTLTNIYLLASSYNNFTYNTMTNTKYGIQIEDDPGDWSISPIPEYFDNYIDTTNTIGGKTVYYYRNQYNTTLSPSSPGFLGCFNCTNVTIRDTSISENGQGILLASTNDSLITNCTIGSNYMGFYFDTATYNNNVTNSLIYGNDYLTVVDLGVNNIFGNDNIYLYDMIVPVSNTWYTSFDEMSFKISNLTYANMICSQYINNTLTKTNTSVKDNQKTNFTYTASEGPHSYYFYCNDTNGTDMFDFSTAAITYGLKYSNNIAGCTLGTHCKSGFCVHNICRAAATYCGDGYCDAGEGACTVDCGSGGSTGGSLPISSVITPIVSTLPPSITFPNTVFNNANGLLIIPEDGAVMSLSIDGKYIIDPSGYPISFVLFGSAGTANVIKTVEITPDQFKETKCYQETLASYVLEIEGENKYLCLNIEDYSKENVIDIKTYKFVDDDWQEISYQDYNGKLCSPITSTPYMIAGFKSSSTQQEALTKILMAESTLEVASESGQDTEYAEQLITEANVAYWSCQYASASDLAIRAVQSVKTIELPLYMILSGVAIILAGILYLFRNKLNFIKFPKKEITSINETTVSEISKKKLKKQK